jgi:uncharacterized protein
MHKCETCSINQMTCCERERIEVPLTPGDIRRIAAFTGRNGFYRLCPVREDLKRVYENPENVRPGGEIYVHHLFDAEGRRNVLAKRDDHRCSFLSADGCELPPEVRPLACRLYPYDWNDDAEIWIDACYCPRGHFADEEEMKSSICLPEAEARRLVDLFYRELGAHRACQRTEASA